MKQCLYCNRHHFYTKDSLVACFVKLTKCSMRANNVYHRSLLYNILGKNNAILKRLLMITIRELKHKTFLSHEWQPEVTSKPKVMSHVTDLR